MQAQKAGKKILFLANSGSGLYDFRGSLIRRLLADGFDVYCCIPDETCKEQLQALGAKVIQIPINRRGTNPLQDIRLYRAYRKLLHKQQPDVVLTYTIKPNIYGGLACRKQGCSYIATVTGLGSVYEGDQGRRWLQRMITRMYRWALRDCSAVFFQNKANMSRFGDLQIAGKKTVLVNGSGVDLTRHPAEPYPERNDGKTLFLYVGRLMEEKGSKELLTAAGQLQEQYGDRFHITIVGYMETDTEETLSEQLRLAQEKGMVTCYPYATQIHPYYKEADVVLMPSWHEGMSNVLMEGAASARPGIASRIPGCEEIVQHEETGLLFPVKDAQALGKAMAQFMSLTTEQKKQMGLAARKRMETIFDREKIVDTYMEQITAALQQNPQAGE